MTLTDIELRRAHPSDAEAMALAHLDSIRSAHCQFQEYIAKQVELRVTVIGDEVFAAAIHSQDRPETSLELLGRLPQKGDEVRIGSQLISFRMRAANRMQVYPPTTHYPRRLHE